VHVSEISFPVYQTTWYHSPEDSIFLLLSALLLSFGVITVLVIGGGRGAQIFQTFSSHFKIPGTRRVT
jgi:hypothetical protein